MPWRRLSPISVEVVPRQQRKLHVMRTAPCGGDTNISMAMLVHEIWEEDNDNGDPLPGLCLAGPEGDGFRNLLARGARLVGTFSAGSHFEAMTIYYHIQGWEPYTTEHKSDYEAYPEEWATRQRGR